MTPPGRFDDLLAVAGDEVVTRAYARDVPLSGGRTLALVTLDNGRDHSRPNTFGPASLLELADTLDRQAERAARGELQAVAVTGKPYILAAGADLSKVHEVRSVELGRRLAELGHYALGKLGRLGVPTFVFINGLALGGGVELALHADYRTIDRAVPAVALPEVFLGLVPGWGGSWLLPNLVGIENALTVIIENPLRNNRTLTGQQAFDLGLADAIFDPVAFLEHSVRWADEVVAGRIRVKRPRQPGRIERAVKWNAAIGIARATLQRRLGTVPIAPYRALDLLRAAKDTDRAAGFAAEEDALAELVAGDQFRASIYAFTLVHKRAKRPAGAPEPTLARPVTAVGVLGAGLMATQLALLFLRRLKVPVVITDLDQVRVDAGLARIRAEIDALREKGRVDRDEANRLHALLSGTTEPARFADCDWVIEAVFEELSAKQDVLAAVEQHVSPEAVLATNTSSLSVDAIAARLRHPERVVGFHLFNPVALMPLVEVVAAPRTAPGVLATALAVAERLKKTPVITTDSPGFVVNRVLARLLGEAMHAVDSGTPIETVDRALAPFGLPMTPFELLELVGLTVAAHVLDSHRAAFPDRFHRSENLHRLAGHGRILDRDGQGRVTGVDRAALRLLQVGAEPMSAEQVRRRVEDGLADEIRRMLDDGVVSAAEDVDLCMLLGAGWPFQMGGVTPYLDRVGASERVFGDTFHHPPIRGIR